MALTTTIQMLLESTLTSPLDLSTPSDPLIYTKRYQWSSGTGASQADLRWHDQRTLTASATEDIDLAGVLSSAFGATLTYARLKGLLIVAAAGNTNNVNVTRPASNGVPIFLAASDGIPVLPGATFAWFSPNATGIAVTAGTGNLITITNSAGSTSVTYDIVVIGASA